MCVLADAYRRYVELSIFQTLLDSHPFKIHVIDEGERESMKRTIDRPTNPANDESVCQSIETE